MSEQVTLTRDGEIAVVTVNNPPVNALGTAVRQGLVAAMEQIDADDAIKAAIIIGEGRTYPAGADIREFGKPPQPPALFEVCTRIEETTKPVIAAIHGTALGGGLEISLGAHYRIADPKGRVGLPEVLIGVMPGAGGTIRLPRIAGIGKALDIMVSGRQVGAPEALELGILDRLAETDLLDDAKTFARELIAEGAGPRKTSDRTEGLGTEEENATALQAARDGIVKKARGLYAPAKMVDSMEYSLSHSLHDASIFERDAFMSCLGTPQQQGLNHAFFAERASAKVPENGRAQPRPLNKIGVIGGGTMGAGITVAALNAGLEVTMVERNAEAIANGQKNVEKVYDRDVTKGRKTEAQKTAIMDRYTPSTNYTDLSDADLIIEAVFENMDVKREVFSTLDKVAKPGAVLASNTSYLNIDEIASATARPESVIGLHFFSPANIMRLLEIVIPTKAADDAIATGFALAKAMKKVPVRAGLCDGFIGNRILAKYMSAAAFMVEDGASPYAIDAALVKFGYPMGIHAMGDLAGLDIGWSNRKNNAAKRNNQDRYNGTIADRICENGWFGQKTGKGWYVYAEGDRRGTPNPDIDAIIASARADLGITPRDFSEEEVIRRYLAAMVNEGARVLEEGIALKPSDIDVTFLFGYGFPRYRGGPMKYADMYGLDNLLTDLREFEKEDPRFWKPAQLLIDMVERGESFDDLNKRAMA
ncbi:3-hydroxyacyl-CoA dehydrogenase NAD-binding domain-containing protein [Alisedimentitalea sp. MJ-SS2]|uniref:3-hydroxyacyl-CoA dehydrogenase NAD-binding domain-containing protein n=1 Tax=Aliisedimentitalea sp. MJ-SS2 TaxID=3049795 RepID=UPI00290ED817|nr:3-hydroxyacyl-CoA dehydrogenase NAD-binding domain-containing protein [Alisedimentitalea sp. MJ-SS2]MDU8927536.1 3-hydroxyacyl-CoA dehydrogenase NAD-binding domain-containing protein [Alisedimentitalea sp. MJ-SS2]